VEVQLALRGAHQIRNAALAGSLAVRAGWSPEAVALGMASVQPEPGRGRLHALEAGGWLLDESYNASQDSILACAEGLLDLEGGETVAILGSMRELGPDAALIHRATGRGLKAMGIRRLMAFGDHAADYAEGFGAGATAFPDYGPLEENGDGLSSLAPGSRILVKGSRYWRSERAVTWLLEHRSAL